MKSNSAMNGRVIFLMTGSNVKISVYLTLLQDDGGIVPYGIFVGAIHESPSCGTV